MIFNFFNKTKPINLVFLSVLLFLFYIITNILYNQDFFLTTSILKNLTSLFVVLGSFLIFNFIVSKNSLTKDTDLGSLLYVLLFGIFAIVFITDKIIISCFFLLLALRRMYSLRTEFQPKQKLFDSGFWIGIATIFYPLSSLFIFLNMLAVFVFNKASWRHFLIPVLGFFIPLIILYSYFFYFDKASLVTELLSISIDFNLNIYKSYPFLLPIVFLSIISFWSIIFVSSRYSHETVSFKASWVLTVFQLLIALIIILISPNKNGREWAFVFFPVSIIIANHIQLIKRKWIKELILYLFIILLISVKFL